MTTAVFHHIVPDSFTGKPWSKADGPDKSYRDQGHEWTVHNLRGREHEFTTDNSGFAVVHAPAEEKLFASDDAIRGPYYAEVEALLRRVLLKTSSSSAGAQEASSIKIKKVHIFDHTVRRARRADAPRQPVQQVHVDQTAAAAAARVRRHLPPAEADELLRGRFAIINAWRPIEYAAVDFPLAVVDWCTTEPRDFIAVDLMYPKRRADSGLGDCDSALGEDDDDDDRGKEKLPDPLTTGSVEGYEPRGEHIQVAPNPNHRFYFQKDMTPDEVLLLKCADSFGEGEPGGTPGLAVRTPHSAFHDLNAPKDAPARQSIEVRCLVFYE